MAFDKTGTITSDDIELKIIMDQNFNHYKNFKDEK